MFQTKGKPMSKSRQQIEKPVDRMKERDHLRGGFAGLSVKQVLGLCFVCLPLVFDGVAATAGVEMGDVGNQCTDAHAVVPELRAGRDVVAGVDRGKQTREDVSKRVGFGCEARPLEQADADPVGNDSAADEAKRSASQGIDGIRVHGVSLFLLMFACVFLPTVFFLTSGGYFLVGIYRTAQTQARLKADLIESMHASKSVADNVMWARNGIDDLNELIAALTEKSNRLDDEARKICVAHGLDYMALRMKASKSYGQQGMGKRSK